MEKNNLNSITPKDTSSQQNAAPDCEQNANYNQNTDSGYNPNVNYTSNANSGYNPNINQNAGYNPYQGYNQNPMYNQNYMYNQPYYPFELKHSGVGITSFIMSLITLLGYFFVLYKAIYIFSHSYSFLDESKIAVLGIVLILLIIINISAFILGIIGTAMRNRKKAFAITGLVISSILLLILMILFIIGASA